MTTTPSSTHSLSQRQDRLACSYPQVPSTASSSNESSLSNGPGTERGYKHITITGLESSSTTTSPLSGADPHLQRQQRERPVTFPRLLHHFSSRPTLPHFAKHTRACSGQQFTFSAQQPTLGAAVFVPPTLSSRACQSQPPANSSSSARRRHRFSICTRPTRNASSAHSDSHRSVSVQDTHTLRVPHRHCHHCRQLRPPLPFDKISSIGSS